MPRGGNRGGGRPNRTGVNWQQPIADARRELRRKRGMLPQAKPVTIDGVEYTSRAEAGRALGIPRQVINYLAGKHGDVLDMETIQRYRPRNKEYRKNCRSGGGFSASPPLRGDRPRKHNS